MSLDAHSSRKGTGVSFDIGTLVQVKRSVLFKVRKLPESGGKTQGSYSMVVPPFTAVSFASLVEM